jgi:hypothetical protein
VHIAAAPFYFESYDWDAPTLGAIERASGSSGYLTGLCVPQRSGELPRDPRFRFANAVHLADASDLAAKAIDFVALAKSRTV